MKRYILGNKLEFFFVSFLFPPVQSALLSVCERMFAGRCHHSSHGTWDMLLSASVSAAATPSPGLSCPNCAVCSSGTSLHCKLSFILTPLVICNNNDEHDITAIMHVPSGQSEKCHRILSALSAVLLCKRLIGEVVQSRRRPLLGPSPG